MSASLRLLSLLGLASFVCCLMASNRDLSAAEPEVIKVGIIGLDTSHVPSFTKTFNQDDSEDVAGFKVVAAYPKGSTVIESSYTRIPQYTEQVKEMGVEIVQSIDELIEKVDVVMLETNDGNPHLEQVIPCLKAGKRTFIDKPIAGSLADTLAIFKAAEIYKTPVFSSSSLRFAPGAQEIRNGSIGDVLGCDAYSPASLDSTHPDLYWYGIHGVETLFTCMGPGCKSVVRTQSENFEGVTGLWEGGRIGTFRGIRTGSSGYGGQAFGTKGIREIGKYGGYRPLVVEMAKFFKTGEAPVADRETIEIYAFMEAADESKRQGGNPVTLEEVIKKAEPEADARLKELGVIK
ncbi:MAG: Gfo/Idh/MocA family oxidoreductase [Planctomycetaceae bacterium]|nr:Gfo/Idh/MocA family oxidoreductase [Planctomycetaceae bacterium]